MPFWLLLASLFAAATISAVYALKRQQSALACITILALLALPPVAVWTIAQAAFSLGMVSAAYLMLVPVLVWWRIRLRGWPDSGDGLGVTGYLLALLGAFIAAVLSGPDTLLAVSLISALALYLLSQFERRPDLIYVAITCGYLGLSQLVTTQGWSGTAYAAILVTSGVAVYAIGYFRTNTDPQRGAVLRLSGVAGPFLGTLLSLTAGPSQAPIFCLAAAGGVFWAEALVLQSRARQEIAGGLLLATYCWLLAYNHISEAQIFSLPWAIYFAYLAGRRHDGEETERNVLEGLALAALTFPVSIQALATNGQLYGIELIFIGLVLMVIGSSQLNRLVLWWGAGTVVIEALYLLPRYFLPGTEYPFIFGLLGLAGFAVAVIVAESRREE